jgi:hypothetical protein
MADLVAQSGKAYRNLEPPEGLGKSRKKGLYGMGGSFLLDGGMGGQSSYPSLEAYTATTGRVIKKGGGLEKLSGKLSQLNIKPKKHNIKFDI